MIREISINSIWTSDCSNKERGRNDLVHTCLLDVAEEKRQTLLNHLSFFKVHHYVASIIQIFL